jgi:hypothetical protein
MGSLSGRYDENAEAPKGFDTFPAGTYELELIEGEVKPTAKGDGELFKHKIRVISGEYEGRLLFGQFNLSNPNPTAQEIGQSEFKALRDVVGVPDPEEPEDLCFRAFTGVVKIRAAKGDFEARNEVDWSKTHKLFTSGGTAPPPKAANDNVKQVANAANSNTKAPWPQRNAA